VSDARSRIGLLASLFAAAAGSLLVYLWFVMVRAESTWAQRSHENRWSFRAVPSQRGRLLDRHDRVLAQDRPTTQLALHYPRFRQKHPVGAAVFGATRWSTAVDGQPAVRYDYGEGALGPEAAVRALLAMPARWLSPRVLPKDVRAELQTAVTTVLATLSGQSRRDTFAAVRKAAAEPGERAVGDVLALDRGEILQRFDAEVHELRRLDAELRALHRERLLAAGLPDDEIPGLLGTLERLRCAGADPDGDRDPMRALREGLRTTFAEHVPFELAAGFLIGGRRHPGIEVEPSVARTAAVKVDTALRSLLGSVVPIDRAAPSEEWLERRLGEALPADWLEDLVPATLLDDDDARESWQGDAAKRYLRELRRVERRGTSGLEAAFDGALGGRLGLRFVERDHARREHRLFGHLEVEAGEDVALTIDLDLQQVAERTAAAAFERWQAAFDEPDKKRKVEAALAVIDAHSGDVLAYAGSPIVSPKAADIPGVVWAGIGDIGSVVKPLLLLEQIDAEAHGRPHQPMAAIEGCAGSFPFANRKLGCTAAHWDGGRDPVQAIAQSCNLFFYQCGIGLGADGVARAVQRFGLAKPGADGEPSAAVWQPSVRGLGVAAPKWRVDTLLPQRAIGYGIEASPLHLARAYAVFATGALPTLGLLRGETRARISFAALAAGLETVRAGLVACVRTGTARRLATLQELGVAGKTGTAEINSARCNNAWFAGYLPEASASGVQLTFCAVVYHVPDAVHGGDAAGALVAEFLAAVAAAPLLRERYLPEERR
jgi:cell division protein FtsI/penicillin-binding protein 2